MMAGTVLVVDDEPKIRDLLRRYLVADGFEVAEATTGEEGLDRVRTLRPDVVVLDVHLPGMDGFDVLAELRRVSTAYVLMLTARAEEIDRLLGLSMGADDYVVKPFSPREVSARVKALLRRSRSPETDTGDVVEVGPLRIDVARRLVTFAGSPVELTVRDTGRGIHPDDLPHIFDRFYRADSSLPDGSGVGPHHRPGTVPSEKGLSSLPTPAGVGVLLS